MINYENTYSKSNTLEKMCFYIPSKRCICSNGNEWMEFLMYVQNWIIVLPGIQNDDNKSDDGQIISPSSVTI
jgi:hypothetical protein